jgi:hypothetical protein
MSEAPKRKRNRTRGRVCNAIVRKDESLLEPWIQELLAQQEEILRKAEAERDRKEYEHRSMFYGASFRGEFNTEEEFEIYRDWREEKRAWAKNGTPIGQCHQILKSY